MGIVSNLYKGLFNSKDTSDLQNLHQEASDTMSVDNRRWLLQMIDERKGDFTKKKIGVSSLNSSPI